ESEWDGWARDCGLPYYPSVSPGWDATPRGVWHPDEPPDRFPWAPVVVDATPERFARHVAAAERWTLAANGPGAPLFIASWNEWSEGHAIEPSARDGDAWLRALGRTSG
ncbi:MAG TPA: glycoside hydrolase family 99-like domain-containing protein, partial [Planctomycetota bacterium]|nr:glycoside hydrolase family 99-like domain-containing protein [Planctomycetota bacterium]